MKKGIQFTDDRGDGGLAEAARFVGAWAGCVPGSPAWKALLKTLPGFDDLDDNEKTEVYAAALTLLTARTFND